MLLKSHSRSAFSLVELSIVLVILGLLTGGILTGQSLIRAAELRSVATEFQKYHTAVQSFRDKYFALPGDMRNATDFWGRAGGTTGSDSACYQSTSGTGTQTCNGDGEGTIFLGAGGGYNERYTFWQHLANAGLIEGTYTGKAGAGGALNSIPGTNVPISRLNQALWYVETRSASDNTSYYFNKNYGNYLLLGGDISINRPHGTIVTAEEMWNIDVKLDDGRPAYGKVIAGNFLTCTMATVYTQLDVDYRLNSSGSACNMFFSGAY